MESPSPKRRKTSPSTSFDVDASNSSIRPQSHDGRATTPSKASYLAPTKASLARFNPNLLPSSNTAGTKRPSSRGSQGLDIARSSTVNVAQGVIDGIYTAARPVTPSRNIPLVVTEVSGRVNGGPLVQNIQSIRGGLFAAPRRRSRTPGRYSSPPKHATYDTRASPPQAAMEIDPVQGTIDELPGQEQAPNLAETLHSTAERAEVRILGIVEGEDLELPTMPRPFEGVAPIIGRNEDEEPRLPSTPTQLGLEPPPEPPKGVLFSSPSRRSKRRTRTSAKSSPLRPRVSATTEIVVDSQERSSLGSRTYYSNLQEATLNSRGASSTSTSYPKPQSLAQCLSLFLPFSKPPPPPAPRPPTPPRVILDTLPDLPLWTLDVTATEDSIKNTPPAPPDDPHLRRKEITFASPQKVLIVKIQATVDLNTKKTTDVTLSSISPWADPELRSWLRKPVQNKDLAAIREATNRYWQLSEIRAKCWLQCEEEFGNLLASSILPDTTKSENTLENRPKGRRKTPNSTDPSTLEPSNLPPSTIPTIPRQSLHYHLGRQSLFFTQTPISLLISWRLAFDATGNLESHLSAHAMFPNPWLQAEGGSELAKVGEAFDGLLRAGSSVFEAVRVVCGAVFVDE